VTASPPASEAAVSPKLAPSAAAPAATEPEVRRAEPVQPGDLSGTTTAPSPNEAVVASNHIQITPVRRSFVTITINGADHPIFSGWLNPSDPPLTYQAQQVTIKAADRGAIEVSKNGAPLAPGDTGVTLE
jgi:hypothetical protein